MTQKSGLDAHIIKKYANTQTIAQQSNTSNNPDLIWGTLGVMAMMNVATQQLRRTVAA